MGRHQEEQGRTLSDLTAINQDLDLGQLIYDMRTEAGLTSVKLAERMETTQSVISRLEEGGGAEPNRHSRSGRHSARQASRAVVPD